MYPLGIALNSGQRSVALMLGAAVALYVASRAAADGLAAGRPLQAGRLALGHWAPIAVVSLVAAAMGQFAVAVEIVFATAVACLSVGVGTLAIVAPAPVAAPAGGRRTWPLLVPAGLLALLIGFHRQVRWLDAAALAIEGLCVLALWMEGPAAEATPEGMPGRTPTALRPVQIVLALALSIVGAGLAIQGLTWAAAASEAATPGLLTATVLAPLIVLPILGSAADLANRSPAAAAAAASSLVGVALLDACAGLPLVVAAAVARAYAAGALLADPTALGGWQGWHRWLGVAAPTVVTATARPDMTTTVSAAVPFPLAVWRVDVVVFLALSAALLPVALGRWSLTRGQGVALVVAFAAYLFLALQVGMANM